MLSITTGNPQAACQKVFDTNELLEQILVRVPSPRDIIRLSDRHRNAYNLIHRSSGEKLKTRTFLAPTKAATEKWVVDRDTDSPRVVAVPTWMLRRGRCPYWFMGSLILSRREAARKEKSGEK